MKVLQPILIALAIFLSGCVNLYIRCPFTDTRVVKTYQSTEVAASLSYVVMFPQVMSTAGHEAFIPENIISIPCGILCYCDVPFEAVVDTICLPYDWSVSSHRDKLKRDGEMTYEGDR